MGRFWTSDILHCVKLNAIGRAAVDVPLRGVARQPEHPLGIEQAGAITPGSSGRSHRRPYLQRNTSVCICDGIILEDLVQLGTTSPSELEIITSFERAVQGCHGD